MAEDMVIDTEVARREDGLVITLHFASGRIEQNYMSAAEARGIHDQLVDALSAGEKRVSD